MHEIKSVVLEVVKVKQCPTILGSLLVDVVGLPNWKYLVGNGKDYRDQGVLALERVCSARATLKLLHSSCLIAIEFALQ